MDPQNKAAQAILDYWNTRFADSYLAVPYTRNDLVTVWFCYILGGWKTLMFINSDPGNYFEVTYNRDKGEMYIDHYVKVMNIAIPDSPK